MSKFYNAKNLTDEKFYQIFIKPKGYGKLNATKERKNKNASIRKNRSF